jgi:predicted transglutaminase-like cysteine proteinase
MSLAAGTAQAIPSPASKAVAPLGFQVMCLRTPAACKPGGAEEIALTKDILKTLRTVNQRVNSAIRPRRDGRTDTWTLNASSGDCEEFVLAKRQKLMDLGLPSSALRIAQVRTRHGEGHAVLVVRTDQGDIVLDNLTTRLTRLETTGYRLVAMSGANPLSWN